MITICDKDNPTCRSQNLPPPGIVGLVKDTKYHNIRCTAEPIAYLALAQNKDTENTMQVLIGSTLPMDAEEQAIRRTMYD
jgi:hypothetical protein